MRYQPIACVWEVTVGCNMRCGHCGSDCTEPLSDELTTEEALNVCDQLADFNMQWVTLSGGEPLTRSDWPLLTKRLQDKGTAVCMITNGMAIDEKVVEQFLESKIRLVTISIDGPRDVHDSIRTAGSYDQDVLAFKLLNQAGIDCGATTTVMKNNLSLLPEMLEELHHMDVKAWQLQVGVPMGRLADREDWMIEPRDIESIVDIAYQENQREGIDVHLADNIGYYTRKEIISRQRTDTDMGYLPVWEGCNAGKRGFGILQNGDVVGCTSIRDPQFSEGNVRKRPLMDIWNDPSAFSWNRRMHPDILEGYCLDCGYVLKCKGGCPNMRLAVNGRMDSENQYCLYAVSKNK